MRNLNQFILERLKLNRDTKIKKLNKEEAEELTKNILYMFNIHTKFINYELWKNEICEFILYKELVKNDLDGPYFNGNKIWIDLTSINDYKRGNKEKIDKIRESLISKFGDYNKDGVILILSDNGILVENGNRNVGFKVYYLIKS